MVYVIVIEFTSKVFLEMDKDIIDSIWGVKNIMEEFFQSKFILLENVLPRSQCQSHSSKEDMSMNDFDNPCNIIIKYDSIDVSRYQ